MTHFKTYIKINTTRIVQQLDFTKFVIQSNRNFITRLD